MMIALHKNARTTPATRAEMAASTETAATLALRFGVSEGTVYKWKGRDSFHDASHTPHKLQTTLTPAQEQIVVELRKTLLLPLDDPKSGSYPAAVSWADGSQGGSGRVILATT
jgi:hypothetical protein